MGGVHILYWITLQKSLLLYVIYIRSGSMERLGSHGNNLVFILALFPRSYILLRHHVFLCHAYACAHSLSVARNEILHNLIRKLYASQYTNIVINWITSIWTLFRSYRSAHGDGSVIESGWLDGAKRKEKVGRLQGQKRSGNLFFFKGRKLGDPTFALALIFL